MLYRSYRKEWTGPYTIFGGSIEGIASQPQNFSFVIYLKRERECRNWKGDLVIAIEMRERERECVCVCVCVVVEFYFGKVI